MKIKLITIQKQYIRTICILNQIPDIHTFSYILKNKAYSISFCQREYSP